MNLSKKLSIPLIIINILMLITIIFISNYQIEKRFEEDYAKSTKEQTESMISEIELKKQEAANGCRYFENSPRILSALSNNSQETIAEFSDLASTAFGYDLFMIIRKDGTLFYRSDVLEQSDTDMTREFPPFEIAIKGEVFNDIYIIEDTAIICATSPIYDNDNEIVATVTVGYNMSTEKFVDYYAGMTDHDITVFVNNKRSMTTLTDSSGQRIIGSELKDPVVIDEVINKHNIYYGKTKIQDINYLCAYIPITNDSDETIILFLGKNMTDVADMSLKTSKTLGSIIAVITVIGVVIMLVFITLFVIRPIKTLTRKLNEVKPLDSNICNLSIRVPDTSKDEIGAIGRQFNNLLDEIRKIVDKIQNVDNIVSSTSETLAASSEETAAATIQVSDTMKKISDSAKNQSIEARLGEQKSNDLSDKLKDTIDNAEDMRNSADETDKVTNIGSESVKMLKKTSQENSEIIKNMSEKIMGLNEKSNTIGSILEVITGISYQTNLLALNASIEAARAGEAGRGFSVVAKEIGVLAEQSKTAATDIQNIVSDIQTEIEEAVNLMKRVSQSIIEQNEAVDNTQYSFNEIAVSVGYITEKIKLVTNLLEDIGSGNIDIVNSINSISDVSKLTSSDTENAAASVNEISAAIEEIANLAQTLNNVSVELEENINIFKL